MPIAKPAARKKSSPKPRKRRFSDPALSYAKRLERYRPGIVPFVLDGLAGLYGRETWQRRLDPTSELILTILTQNSADTNAEVAFEALRRAYPSNLPPEIHNPGSGWGGFGLADEHQRDRQEDRLDRPAVLLRPAPLPDRPPRRASGSPGGAAPAKSDDRRGPRPVPGAAPAGPDVRGPREHDPARPEGLPCPAPGARTVPADRAVPLRGPKGAVTPHRAPRIPPI